MNVGPESRSELKRAARRRHAAASKTEKTAVVNTVREAAGYHRKYAITILSREPRRGAPMRHHGEISACRCPMDTEWLDQDGCRQLREFRT